MMRRRTLLIVLPLLIVLGAVGAYAWFSATGSGSASASTGTLAKTTITTHSASGVSVSLAWDAVTAPGGGPVDGYYVLRDGSSADSACGSASSPITATSCTDTAPGSGTFSYTVVTKWRSWLSTSDAVSVTVNGDTTAPYVISIDRVDSTPTNGAAVHWTVKFSESVTGVDTGDYALVGAGATGASISGVSGSGDTYSVTASTGNDGSLGLNLVDDDSIKDGAGNPLGTSSGAGDGSFTGQTYSIDKTGPTNSLSLTARSPAGSSLKSGNTIYYRGAGGGSGGSFQIRNAVSDAGSGPASSTTAALGGATTGWSHTPGTVSTPAGGPYDSSVFTWAEGTTSSPTEVVTGADAAGNATAAPVLTLVNDSTAPTGGALTVNGVSAGGAGTESFNGTGSFSISAITDYTDAGSGVASSTLVREQASLSSSDGLAAGTCGSTWTNATTISSRAVPVAQTLSGPTCYRYTLTGVDNLGNSASIFTVVKVDTTGPTAPSVTVSSATGNTFINGSTVYTNPQVLRSGGFSVAATTGDADSGVQKVSFPSLAGFTSGGGDDTSSPYSTTYAWSGAGAVASGSQTVTAFNNSSLQASGSFTVTPDTTAPTGGSVDATGLVGTGSRYSTSTTLSIAFTKGTDGGSGLAATGAQLLRASATLSSSDGSVNGSCGTYGAFTQVGANDPSSPYPDNAAGGITTGTCFKYEYLVPDNVGNVATYTSGDIKVDTTAPTLVLSATGANVSTNGTAVFFKSGSGSFTITASDSQSGITSASFAAATSGWTRSVSGNSATYTLSGATVSSTLGSSSDTNNAAATTTRSSVAVTLDTTPPSNSLTLVNQGTVGGNATSFLTSSRIYYNGSAASGRTFQIQNAVADGGSGPGSSLFPALAGTSTGFSFSSSTVSTPSGGPYVSNAFTWSSGTSSAPTETVTGADAVGNTTAAGTLTLTNDTTVPTGGVLSVNSTAASGVGTTSTSTTGSFSIGTRTDYAETQGTTQSGLASSTLVRDEAPLSADGTGACGTFASATTIVGTPAQSVATDKCYRYTLTGTDNVGNSVSISTIVKVDTPPNAPVLTITATGGFAFANGTTAYYGTTGTSSSLAVSATTSDPETGIQSVTFPALTSFTGGGVDSTSPYGTTYTWANSSDSGTKTVTATNGIGQTATSTFSLVHDVNAPSGGTLSVNGAGSGTTNNTSGSFPIATLTQYSETQSGTASGLASSALVRDQVALNPNGTGCGTTWTNPTTISATRTEDASTGIATGNCYRYTLTGTDRVGNTASISTIVRVDTTAPTFGSPELTFSTSGNNAYYSGSGTAVYYNGNTGTSSSFTVSAPNVADPESGIQNVIFPIFSGFTGGGTDSSSPFSATYTWSSSGAAGAQTVTATNGIGAIATSPFSLVRDVTAPSGGALTVNGTAAAATATSSFNTTGSFAIGTRTDYSETQSGTASGLASSSLVRTRATLNGDGTCGTFGSPVTISDSPTQDAAAGISDGNCYQYTLTGSDNVNNSASVSTIVKVDATAPTVATLTLNNGGGGAVAGTIEQKDSVILTYSEPLDMSTLCSAWTGTGSQSLNDVTVTVTDGGSSNDTLTVSSPSCTFHLGTIDLGATGYATGGNLTFFGTGGNKSQINWTANTGTLTISLGAQIGPGTAGNVSSSVATLNPDSNVKDVAGNPLTASFSTANIKQF
jgi:hypothetical protein